MSMVECGWIMLIVIMLRWLCIVRCMDSDVCLVSLIMNGCECVWMLKLCRKLWFSLSIDVVSMKCLLLGNWNRKLVLMSVVVMCEMVGFGMLVNLVSLWLLMGVLVVVIWCSMVRLWVRVVILLGDDLWFCDVGGVIVVDMRDFF